MKGLCDRFMAGLKAGFTRLLGDLLRRVSGATLKTRKGPGPNRRSKSGNVNKRSALAIGKYHFRTNDAAMASGHRLFEYTGPERRTGNARNARRAALGRPRHHLQSSNNMPFKCPVLSKLTNCWRTTGDIRDNWQSMTQSFGQDKMGPYASPRHWNDPDMLVVALSAVGAVSSAQTSGLTAGRVYTHISLLAGIIAAIIGCNLERWMTSP